MKMNNSKWFRIEVSREYDFARSKRFIIKTYKFLGIPIYVSHTKWD